ncbi:PBP1A family penicillin-binding protein [Lentibacillus halophilus]|uniref:PBP1A family penicillin-binding protein n=1 Tax=Lentibacillus halophilus TaxID=295065 RepID=A0ABN0ZDP6_9BACI
MATNGQSRTARRQQKKASKKPLWKKILLWTLIAILAIGISVGGLFTYYIATAPNIDASKLDTPFSSKFYDKDGEQFADLGKKQRTKVEYDELPDVLIDAVIATEDARFFDHPGIDIWRIGGAIVANITDGFGSEGASTITQQVVEKSFLPPDKKISLKVQEMWLALQLEQKYNKERIMEMYLNKIYYGKRAYGVVKAAEVYFGKTDLSELTLPEAAILAGLPQRPSAYNPFKNPELMKDRMSTVLQLMVQHDKISEKQAKEAKQVEIASLLTEDEPDSTPYQAFLQQVEKEVKKNVDGADIYTDGLKIYTTIDTDAQKYVEFLLSDKDDNPINYPEPVVNPKSDEGKKVDLQAGMTVLDTKTGAVRAIGGAHGGLENQGFNHATQIDRQPGSTFKPIVDYGPAIENMQWSTYHQLNDDGPYDIKGSDKQVETWDSTYYGWVTARYALQRSLNVPAIKTFEEVGRQNAKAFAEKLGITFGDKKIKLTDAIGGGDIGTNPLELAGAYRAFANGGIYNKPYTVTKVEFPGSGKTVNLKPEPEAVMADSTAYMITDMLKNVVTEGTGTSANISGLQVAGKTGTTTRPDVNGSPDSWFSGYSTNYTMSIWTGYDNNNIPIDDKFKNVSQRLFKHTMMELSKNIETPDFTKPDSVVEQAVEKGSRPAKLPSNYTPESQIVTELFVKGTAPTETSEKYDQLEPVNNLEATFDNEANAIQVTWEYNSKQSVSFEVSARVDGDEKQKLSSTEETSMEITNVEPGSDYEIEVIASSHESAIDASEPVTTTVSIPEDMEDDEDDEEEEEDEEENNNEQGNIPSVDSLQAKPTASSIDVSWQYNGPPAQYEVVVSRSGSDIQTKTVRSKGIVLEGDGVRPGQTYTITVTPVGQEGANKGVKGLTKSTKTSVPDEADSVQGNSSNNHDGEASD